MVKYRNVQTGRVLERPHPDEWLEASSGWSREESEPKPADKNKKDERSNN